MSGIKRNELQGNIKRFAKNIQSQKKASLETITKKIKLIEKEASDLTGYENIRKYRDLQNRITILREKQRVEEEDDKLKEFEEILRPLTSVVLTNKKRKRNPIRDIKQRAHFNNIFNNVDSSPIFIDREVCPGCGDRLLVLDNESKTICQNRKCGISQNFMYCESDYTTSKPSKTTTYQPVPLYRQFVEQFHEDEKNPPDNIMEAIMKHISHGNETVQGNVKPTFINKFLYDNKMRTWLSMSMRIAKFINNQRIPKFSTELIDRLVERFRCFTNSKCETNHKKDIRKKKEGHNFMTHTFLVMENLHADAECFNRHRTRNILRNAHKRVKKQCSMITNSNLNWNMKVSC